MVTLGEFSRLVTAIHDAAVTPAQWVNAMDEVRHSLNAITGAMLIAEDVGRSAERASLPPDAHRTYREYYHQIDYVLEAVERGPVGHIHGGRQLIDIDPKSEFNNDWVAPNHMDDGLFVRLTASDHPACFILADPRRDEPFVTTERAELTAALIPHFQHALRTEKHLEDLKRDAADLAGAIDSMRQAVLVVGANSIVLHCNLAGDGLLHQADGLKVRGGKLCALRPDVDCALQRAVADALGHNETGARSGTSVLCPRPSGGRAYVAHAFPFPNRDHHGEGEPRALLVVVDPDNRPQPPKAMLRNLFGLTNGEADVALRVANGQGLAPISEELSVSVATVKTHLQHVFDKTDTHRQAELVRLLTALLP
ncbi:helix-turn-helix transcriptional regulator [Mycobacterium sp. GA-2829]|uniref:helix-turn-helix transcriptional regulator n=1 Tax=Mycobacterium sp. GA-2829 TaxID=1772283 RepID=UPI0007402A2D|nr:helix-turn-helix transcriptional regulator [Mycobacterium sp. GA-2829]KUI27462.1 LuxR family transcriptional regulator [Mycobacterium sp. GA-2829]